MNTITRPKAKSATYPAAPATKITWSYTLDGKPSELNHVWIRLGAGIDIKKVTWKRLLDIRGAYKNGCVDGYLKKDDLPKTKKGEKIYGEIMAVPKYLREEGAKKKKQNHEREIALSKPFAIVP